MKGTRLLYLSWLLAIAALIAIVTTQQKSATTFYGIAETREIIVNSEYPVEIKSIHVASGQVVKRNELLVELARPELAKQINDISHQLEEIGLEQSFASHELVTRINALKAQKASQVSDIDYRIKQLQAQYDINKALASGLKSLDAEAQNSPASSQSTPNPTEIQIKRLRESLKLSVEPLQIQIEMMEKELASTENPLKTQEESLRNALYLLLEEKNRLYKFSPVDGVIGSVNYKIGEKITPFAGILTLHTKTPSYIRGFVNEKDYQRINIGQKMRIASLADAQNSLIGTVIGVGSRIVEYPPRLKEMLAIPVWGREVLIKIDPENRYLLGEKVLITMCDECEGTTDSGDTTIAKNLISPHTYARAVKPAAQVSTEPDQKIYEMAIDRSLKQTGAIEPSGIIYLDDLKQYLVISDSTPANRPILYLMDSRGLLHDEIAIQGLKEIMDMEAIAQDEAGRIYILCSQSYDNKGQLPLQRKLLLRLMRNRALLTLDSQVVLYDQLADLLRKSPASILSNLVTGVSDRLSINLEGIACRNNSLYIGFKRPLKDNQAMILEIAEADHLFDHKTLNESSISIWKQLDLTDPVSGESAGISDLYYHHPEKKWFILTAIKGKSAKAGSSYGNLWVLDETQNKIEMRMTLDRQKPEGITYNPDEKSFIITFDKGRTGPAEYMTFKGAS